MILFPKPGVVFDHHIITGPVSSLTNVSQPDALYNSKLATGCHHNISTHQFLSEPVIVITAKQTQCQSDYEKRHHLKTQHEPTSCPGT